MKLNNLFQLKKYFSKKVIIIISCVIIILSNIGVFSYFFDSVSEESKYRVADLICQRYNSKTDIVIDDKSQGEKLDREGMQLFTAALLHKSNKSLSYFRKEDNKLIPWDALVLGVSWLSDTPVSDEEFEAARNRYKNIFTLTYEEYKSISKKDFYMKSACDSFNEEKRIGMLYEGKEEFHEFGKLNNITPKDMVIKLFFSNDNDLDKIIETSILTERHFSNVGEMKKLSNDDLNMVREIRSEFEWFRVDNQYNSLPYMVSFIEELTSFDSVYEYQNKQDELLETKKLQPLKGEIDRVKIYDEMSVDYTKVLEDSVFMIGEFAYRDENQAYKRENIVNLNLEDFSTNWSYEKKGINSFIEHNDQIAIAYDVDDDSFVDIVNMKSGEILSTIKDDNGFETKQFVTFDENSLIVEQQNKEAGYLNDRIYDIANKTVIKNINWSLGKPYMFLDNQYYMQYSNNNGCFEVKIIDLTSEDLDVYKSKKVFSKCLESSYHEESIHTVIERDKVSIFNRNQTVLNNNSIVEIDLNNFTDKTFELNDQELSNYNIGSDFGLSFDKDKHVSYYYKTGFYYSLDGTVNPFLFSQSTQVDTDSYFMSDDKKYLYIPTRDEGLYVFETSKL